MGLFVALNDIVQLRPNSQDGQSEVFNILHYKLVAFRGPSVGTPPPTTLSYGVAANQIGSAWQTACNAFWAAASSSTMKLVGTSVQCIDPLPRTRSYNQTLVVPLDGELTAPMLPTQDAVTLLKRTNGGARTDLGRYFHSGIPEDQQQAGIVDAGYRALLGDYADRLETTLVVDTAEYRMEWQPALVGLLGGVVIRDQLIEAFELSDSVIKTQRRRRPGKGI